MKDRYVTELYRETFFPTRPGEFRIANTEVRNFALPAEVTTKLVGTLTSKDMQSDAWIRWVSFAPTFPTLYSQEAARSHALVWFAGIVVIGALLIQIRAPHLSRKTAIQGLFMVLMVGAVIGVLRLVTLKTTEVHLMRGGFIAINDFRQLDGAIEQFAIERDGKEPLTFAELRASLTNYMKYPVNNCFTGKPLRQEASSGNVTLHSTTNGTEVFWYDINGNAHALTTFKDGR